MTKATPGAAFAADDAWAGFVWTKRDANGQTHEPIHHGSRPTLGAHEPARRITPKQRDGWLKAFDRHAKVARPNGVRRGHKGTYSHAAHSVLAYFLDLATVTGRIFPSYKQIAAVLDLPRSLVHSVLAQLEGGGWIKRERRFRKAPTAGQVGPQLEQDTNWYTVDLPLAAARLLKAWQRRDLAEEADPPPPDELAARQRGQARERLGRHRRGLEQNLRQVRGYLATATDAHARRKLAAAAAELEAQIGDTLRREAALSDNTGLRSATAAERRSQPRESRKGGESSSGEKQTKQGQGSGAA